MRGGRQPARTVRSIIDTVRSFEEARGSTGRRHLLIVTGNSISRVGSADLRTVAGAVKRLDLRLGTAEIDAQRIRVKNNLLLFYPDRNAVVKLFAHREALEAHTHGVERARSCFRTMRVQVPTAVGLSPTPWLEEELIRYPQPNHAEVRKQLVGIMTDLASLHSPSDSRDILSLPEDEIERFLTRAQNEGLTIPVLVRDFLSAPKDVEGVRGFCHGDLSLGNMLRHPEGILLIDWEMSSLQWVVVDLLKITGRDPTDAFEAYASVRFPQADQRRTVAGLHLQAALYVAKRFARGQPRRDYFVQRGDPASYNHTLSHMVGRVEMHLRTHSELTA